MTLDEFDTLTTLTALTTGCYMLKELTDDLQYDIPDEIQEPFGVLQRVLVEIQDQVHTYGAKHKSTYIDEEK